jgi:Putative DNA-binding domain
MPPVEGRGEHSGEPSYAAVFAAALLDPDVATPAAVAGPKSKGARKRYDVYRNNVTVSLINALAAVFPATQRITGEDFFRAMARFYVADLTAVVRVWTRLSRLHRTVRICAISALAGGCGADRAGMARRIPRRRYSTADATRLGFHPSGAAGRYYFETSSRGADRPLTFSGSHYFHCKSERRLCQSRRGCRGRGRLIDKARPGCGGPTTSARRRNLSDAPHCGRISRRLGRGSALGYSIIRSRRQHCGIARGQRVHDSSLGGKLMGWQTISRLVRRLNATIALIAPPSLTQLVLRIGLARSVD